MSILNEHIVDASVDGDCLDGGIVTEEKVNNAVFFSDEMPNFYGQNYRASNFPACRASADHGSWSSGVGIVVPVFLLKDQIIRQIKVTSGGTASSNLTHSIVGLYDYTTSAKLAESTDITSEWTANTCRVFHLTASYTVPATGVYYVAILITATTTMPSLVGLPALITANVLDQAGAKAGTFGTGLSALPDPLTEVTASLKHPHVSLWWAVS